MGAGPRRACSSSPRVLMTNEPTIVSLLASATEIVCGLGLRHRLIGRSHECDYPEDVADLPVLSAPKVDINSASGEIDRQVREVVRDGLSVYDIRVDELERLQPDLIVTQDQCEVCAVSLTDVEGALCQVTLKDTKICTLHPNNIDDVTADFQQVADASGVPERGRELVNAFTRRLADIEQRSAGLSSRPRVAMIEWMDPVMVAGGWIPELVRVAGGEPVIVESPEAFKTVEWSEIAAADPDVVVILPCGYDLSKTLGELEDDVLAVALESVPAVRRGKCYVADGNAYFNRPGPRLADSAEMLAALLHPDLFPDALARYRDCFTVWTRD